MLFAKAVGQSPPRSTPVQNWAIAHTVGLSKLGSPMHLNAPDGAIAAPVVVLRAGGYLHDFIYDKKSKFVDNSKGHLKSMGSWGVFDPFHC